jgi:hypothetical protein
MFDGESGDVIDAETGGAGGREMRLLEVGEK